MNTSRDRACPLPPPARDAANVKSPTGCRGGCGTIGIATVGGTGAAGGSGVGGMGATTAGSAGATTVGRVGATGGAGGKIVGGAI